MRQRTVPLPQLLTSPDSQFHEFIVERGTDVLVGEADGVRLSLDKSSSKEGGKSELNESGCHGGEYDR